MIDSHGARLRLRAARCNSLCLARAVSAIFVFLAASLLPTAYSHAAALSALPITERHADMSRGKAAKKPHKEADQKLIDGWPMYRTNRGQEAFNAAMATLAATDGPAPSAGTFKGCKILHCNLLLPKIDRRGWIPAGRIWVAPDEYVLIVRSPRKKSKKRYRRRSRKSMKYFVFHEFHNSTRNTDVYDTVSAHKFSVFVPFYLSKQGTDARGNKFAVVVQVAPYDVVSRHASNMGSRGPGVEIAKNKWEKLTSVQSKAGIVLTSIVMQAAPKLRAVHHRHKEGLPMLMAYKKRIAALKKNRGAAKVRLPFTPASAQKVARAKLPLGALITRKGVKRIVRVAKASGKPRKKTRKVARKAQNATVVVAKVPTPKAAQRVRKVAYRRPTPTPMNIPKPSLVWTGHTPGVPEPKPASMEELVQQILSGQLEQ